MGDVKIHKAFPTSIYEFEHKSSELEQKNMEKYISEADKNLNFIQKIICIRCLILQI